MVNSILLRGWLSKESIVMSAAELTALKLAGQNKADLVIDSTEGDAEAAVAFVEFCREIRLDLSIKIYEAKSAAALIAISIDSYREMSRDKELGLHRPDFRVSPTQVDQDGKIDKPILEKFKQYDTMLLASMKRVGLGDSAFTTPLHATDWLCLPAEVCLRLGIVHRLF